MLSANLLSAKQTVSIRVMIAVRASAGGFETNCNELLCLSITNRATTEHIQLEFVANDQRDTLS